MKDLNEQLADCRLQVRLGMIVAAEQTRAKILATVKTGSRSFKAGRRSHDIINLD